MSNIEKSYYIDRPKPEVFEFVSDPTNDPKWRESTVLSEWTSAGPPGVGSTMRSVDKFLGRTLEYTLEITAWDPPNTYGAKASSGPIPVDFTLKFESEGPGTRINLDGDIELGGVFKMAGGLVRSQLDKQFDKEWAELKRILEDSPST